MEPVEIRLPIHSSCLMTPLKDNRRGNCCGNKFEAISDGFYCKNCDEFFHKTCSNAPDTINYSHKCSQTLFAQRLILNNWFGRMRCSQCRETVESDIKIYMCPHECDIVIHVGCAKYQPPEVIDVPQNHNYKLMLEKVESCFTCASCGKDGDGYSYKCHECELTFHVICKMYAAEINHPSHSLHPLKLLNGEPPAYTDGKCRLCGEKPADEAFYHCSLCNFILDIPCVNNPAKQHHDDPNIHPHSLTLMPKSIAFTCTVCGLPGDRSPYVCLPCDFAAHNDCSGFPYVININRHDHRVSRTSLIGVVNSRCGVCQKKLDWSCGGYCCQRCPNSVFHTKCATRGDVWDGIEMKDEPDEDDDEELVEVIDENTIRHSLHNRGHNLRLDKSGIFIEERSCDTCAYPIYHLSFYSCIACKFLIHETCANLPRRKRHAVSNLPLKLDNDDYRSGKCEACGVCYNGFSYEYDNSFRYRYGYDGGLDMRCASISGSFVHQSHPDHPLFYTSPLGVCSVCNKEAHHVLRCVEDDCGYIMDYECALLPYEVKHLVDDHFLSLCFGEKDVNGKYWCDICEKETDPKKWFYTCKDCGVTLHTGCVLGDTRSLCQGNLLHSVYIGQESKSFEVVRNNSMSRPNCSECKSGCIFPVYLKQMKTIGYEYYCSVLCADLG